MKTQEEKDGLLAQLKHHQELDAFVQGQWLQEEKIEGNGFKGCFYGCTMQSANNPREEFSEKYDIDLWYCYLTEKIFEGLPDGEFQSFPYQSIKIVPLNYDFNKAKSAFHRGMLLKQLEWVKDEKCREAIQLCADLFLVPFNEIEYSAESARSAAWSAWSAAESAESARSAARSARSAARSAWSAAESAESAWSAAKTNHYIWLRDFLFECITNNQ